MHGDFTLNPTHYRDPVSRVLFQQGRVQLDSDLNEQTEVVLRFLRTLAADVIGPHGGTAGAFEIKPDPDPNEPFLIGYGHYYVDGILCVNKAPRVPAGAPEPKGLPWSQQPNRPSKDAPKLNPREKKLIYLDVWERHISAAEDDSLREVALLGPDTASRAVIVWQVRVIDVEQVPNRPNGEPNLAEALRTNARLRADAAKNTDLEPCIISPDARFRGEENRLYRVEIHSVDDKDVATFKWSADNGSIVYPVRDVQGTTIVLESLGRDERTAISVGDWVELVDDDSVLQPHAYPLVQVTDVDRARMEVTVDKAPENLLAAKSARNAILRRWAEKPQKINAVKDPTDKTSGWVELDEGVTVQFSGDRFRTGDYWLIPARTATGDVIWPEESPDQPAAIPPHGIRHHYAPLATWDGKNFPPLRKTIKQVAE